MQVVVKGIFLDSEPIKSNQTAPYTFKLSRSKILLNFSEKRPCASVELLEFISFSFRGRRVKEAHCASGKSPLDYTEGQLLVNLVNS